MGRLCSCARPHSETWGKTDAGVSRGLLGREYATGFAEFWSRLIVERISWDRAAILSLTPEEDEEKALDDEVPGLEEESEDEMPHPATARGPPALSTWANRGRWRRAVVLKWNRHGHINILELRMLVMGIRHSGRVPSRRRKRIVMFTDSLVALGALAKGRSASRGLNQEIRRAASHLFTFGTRPYLRYLHTSKNPADVPSRGQRIGVVHHYGKRTRGPKFIR